MVQKTLATLGALKDVVLGMMPFLPHERRFGVDSLSPEELTDAVGPGVDGARIEAIEVELDSKGTTDRARVRMEWNEAGRAAGLPASLFAKGTPSTASSRVLNSAFGLCGSEVRFYNEVYPAVAEMTLKPYVARVGPGGRFVIALEDVASDRTFFQPGDEPPLAHAEGIMDALAELHARFWESPRFGTDLAWITTAARRPGHAIAHRFVLGKEPWLHARGDVPGPILELTRFAFEHRDELERLWESLPVTLCHGDSHLGNTYHRADGSSGLFDWQNVQRMNGIRDVAYFMGHSLPTELRRAQQESLLRRYLEGLRERGLGDRVPSFEEAFDLYRLLMLDTWTSVWASLAIGGLAEVERGEVLMKRLYDTLLDLDTARALRDAL